jgi:hypothetical protein
VSSPAIRILPDMVELLGQSGFARQIGLLLLTVWAILALVGVALIFLAWKMVHGDRVARGLSYVLLGGLGGAILIGDEQPTELVLGMLACFVALAVLALAPSLREFFGGAPVVGGEQPAPVVQARMLVAIWAATMIFVGVMFLALDDLDRKFLPIGVLLVVLGAATWYVNGRLAKGEPAARTLISAAASAYLILLLILGEGHPGLILPLALAAGAVVHLWTGGEVQQHFSATAPP